MTNIGGRIIWIIRFMHLYNLIICTLLFSFCGTFLPAGTGSVVSYQTLKRVPPDSILVLSIDGKKITSKSGILESQKWFPLLDHLEKAGSPIRSWFSDSNDSGIVWEDPVHFFVRLHDGEHPSLQFGAIARARSPEQADRTLADLADFLGLRPSKRNPEIYQRTTQPFAIGRAGNLCFLIGNFIHGQKENLAEIDSQLDSFVSSLSQESDPESVPSPLLKHSLTKADLAVYLEGTGLGRMLENWEGNSLASSFIPLFDPLFQSTISLYLDSGPGNFKLRMHNYSHDKPRSNSPVKPLEIVDQLPGDAPLVARLSIPKEQFLSFLFNAVDTALRFLTRNNFGVDSELPGFQQSARNLLTFPSGDFVFAGGSSRLEQVSLPGGQSVVHSHPIWTVGARSHDTVAYKELLAGARSGMGISTLLNAHGIRLVERTDAVWLSTPEYSREIELGQSIQPLAFQRRKLLNNNSFALDFNPKAAARALRKTNLLSFDQLKGVSWLDEFNNLNLHLNANNELVGNLLLSRLKEQGWRVISERLAQEWIDRINARLFAGIAQDDLNTVIESVSLGALINANDRFGHSPLHYAAYRGNTYIVDYLLRHGGNPNTRGEHLSTPLHSAAWGKNQEVVELLLEDGAEVDARTDEKETPLMTATLRGQTDIVQTLLALSADPRAVDAYGTNLMDLAGASGNPEMVEIFKKNGVNTHHPLHLAAGIGDIGAIKSWLESGRSINEQDSFGATPLLVATVAGQVDTVHYLLQHSADPTIQAKDGYSILHAAAFSGKKSLIRKMLAFGMDINQRFGPDKITPTDVGEEGTEGLLYLRSMGGRSAWELGPE